METRLEKNKRKKRRKIKKMVKSIIFLMIIFSMIIGINMVNNTIKSLNCMENTKLLSFNLKNHNLEFLGKKYLLDLKALNFD